MNNLSQKVTMQPLVSVCLPNLRNRAYLPERIDSIVAQTWTDWELVVFDNYSDDGAWEYLCERAATEPRMRVTQAPREGMYANWNNCIRAAQGKYVYIATSDDNMAPDCLEKLVAALELHPECGVAHTRLHVFGENYEAAQAWWNADSMLAQSSGGRGVATSHLRCAPLDGLLHTTGLTVVVSITQALIRRNVFDTVGYFPNDCGVVGDFAWHARCGWSINSVYVADTWGGWRLHAAQATALNPSSQAGKVWVNYQLYVRAVKSFLATKPEPKQVGLAKLSLRVAYAHAVHASGRGQPFPVRMARLFWAILRAGLALKLVSWGPKRLIRYLQTPAQFAVEEAARLRPDWIRPT